MIANAPSRSWLNNCGHVTPVLEVVHVEVCPDKTRYMQNTARTSQAHLSHLLAQTWSALVYNPYHKTTSAGDDTWQDGNKYSKAVRFSKVHVEERTNFGLVVDGESLTSSPSISSIPRVTTLQPVPNGCVVEGLVNGCTSLIFIEAMRSFLVWRCICIAVGGH